MAKSRLYFVTFDIEGSATRQGDYKKVEDALKAAFSPANYYKVIKQCCFIRTRGPGAVAIRDVIKRTLGSQCNIAAVRLGSGYAIKIRDAMTRAKAGKVFKLPKKK